MRNEVPRILLVDDEQSVLEKLTEILSPGRYHIESAVNGEQALAKIRNVHFDFVLADLQMPGMGGMELLRQAKEVNPSLEVLVMTEPSLVAIAREAERIGAIGYVIKPLDDHTIKILKILVSKILELNRWKERSGKDDPTGLYNIYSMDGILKTEFARAKRYDFSLSLLIVDMDKFQIYNELNSYAVGSKALQVVADILQSNTCGYDFLCRYEGDGFAIVAPHTGLEEAKSMGERILLIIWETDFPGEKNLPQENLTASIGLANFPAHTCNKSELVQMAVEAHSKAKQKGGNCLCVWNE